MMEMNSSWTLLSPVISGWKVDASNPMNYGIVAREGNTNPEGIGIAGGIAAGPEGYEGHVTFYIEVPDVEAALAKAESLGGMRIMGPEKMEDPPMVLGMLLFPFQFPKNLVQWPLFLISAVIALILAGVVVSSLPASRLQVRAVEVLRPALLRDAQARAELDATWRPLLTRFVELA